MTHSKHIHSWVSLSLLLSLSSSILLVETYRITIIRPRGPFEMTVLDVKWEIFDRNITWWFEHSMAKPNNLPRPRYDHICVDGCRVVLSIRTECLIKSDINKHWNRFKTLILKWNSHFLIWQLTTKHKNMIFKEGLTKLKKALTYFSF